MRNKMPLCCWTVILSISQILINSQSNNTSRAKALSTGGNCYDSSLWREGFEWKKDEKKETERPKKKQEVKDVKGVEKNAQES